MLFFLAQFNQTHKSMYAIYCSNYDNAEQRVLKVRKRKDIDDILKVRLSSLISVVMVACLSGIQFL